MKFRIPRARFSLRFLIALVFLCGCGLWLWRVELRPYQRQAEAIARLQAAGARCETEVAGRPWLRSVMGDDAFQIVTVVDLSQCHQPEAYRDALPLIPTVRTIHFGRGLTDEDVLLLSGCNRVREVDLSETLVGDAGGSVAQNWPDLRNIRLGFNCTDAAADWLSGHRELRFIDFGRSQMTDEGLRQLRDLPELQKVVLDGRPITDDGLRFVLGLGQLKELYLRDCTGVTDHGMRRLGDLPLTHLDVRGCRLSPITVFYLQDSLPDCEVVSDDPLDY